MENNKNSGSTFMKRGGTLLCEMDGVREYGEMYPVQLIRHPDNGRLVIRAINEGGYNSVDIDLWDILDWMSRGPIGIKESKDGKNAT